LLHFFMVFLGLWGFGKEHIKVKCKPVKSNPVD
jgi:hypothetical protein